MLPKRLLVKYQAIIFLAFLVGGFLLASPAKAADSEVRGAAWWGDLNSYLYLSCKDAVIGDRLNDPNNLCGGETENCGPPDNVFHFYAEPCLSLQHGVLIDEDGKFKGEAWHYSKGLVSFTATTTPPTGLPPDKGDLLAACPICYNDSTCWACYNETDQKVYGWARSTSDGTWIKLNEASYDTNVQIKSWDADNPTAPYYNLSSGDFVGTASSTAGALSFNCLSEEGGDSCALRDYKVYIGNLQIGNTSAPNWSFTNACSSGTALRANLSWDLKSGSFLADLDPDWDLDYQTAFEIILSTSDDINSPICTIGSSSSSANQLITVANCPGFTYNTNYFWWLRLKNQDDVWTEWHQYDNNSILDTDRNLDNNQKTFTTYMHEFPSPFFVWEPADLSESVGTTTMFSSFNNTNRSQYYTTLNPTLALDCDELGCDYLWEVDNNPGTVIDDPIASTTGITFFNPNPDTTVTLTITDSEGYYCRRTEILSDINYGLPIWREVQAR